MLAVDLSGSMEMEDFVVADQVVNRLVATQQVAGQFIERRTGDRVGLILFGEKAYLQAPLTFDRTTVRTLLDEAVIGLAGDKTAIGDAIGLAIKRLRNNPAHQRVLILLTDGANTAGEIPPLQAAELAAQEGLRIHTIGVGADEWIVAISGDVKRSSPPAISMKPPCRVSRRKPVAIIFGQGIPLNWKISMPCSTNWNRSSGTPRFIAPAQSFSSGRVGVRYGWSL